MNGKSGKDVKKALPRGLTKELDQWLKGRKHWSHDDWLKLLAGLRAKGHTAYTETAEGRTAIGNYLEANRKK